MILRKAQEGTRIAPIQILLGQFKRIIVWILIVAGVIFGVPGDLLDSPDRQLDFSAGAWKRWISRG
jgi:hypothetical protein